MDGVQGVASGTRKQAAVTGLRGRRLRSPILRFTRIAPTPHHEVQLRLFLDIVVGDRSVVLEPLARKDQVLLVRRNALPVLDLGSAI